MDGIPVRITNQRTRDLVLIIIIQLIYLYTSICSYQARTETKYTTYTRK